MSPLPHRPRLATHALVRRHAFTSASGARRDEIVIHHAGTHRMVRLELRVFELVAGADGTRDLDALLLFAARSSAYRRASEVRALLHELHQFGLLADGLDPVARTEAGDRAHGRPDRPIVALPGFTMVCDRGGDCCRQYPSIGFEPVDVARARATLPDVFDAGRHPERVFLPLAGPLGGDGPSAGPVIDGRCAYLGVDTEPDACGLHARAGGDAKPLGCRLFPVVLVDDGDSIRASAKVECSCVLRSVGRDDGAPLVPGGARTRGALDPAIDVAVLAASVLVAGGAPPSPVGSLIAWSRAVADAAPTDALSGAVALVEALEAHGLALAPSLDAMRSTRPLDPDALRARLAPLAGRAHAAARSAAEWRSADDASPRLRRKVADALTALATDRGVLSRALAAPEATVAREEAFYLRSAIFGHQLVSSSLPLADALADRAMRLLAARALPFVHGGAQALATVEVAFRTGGLGR